ncbi:Gag-Pol polyprotein [Plecturocebus cupreus]
MHLLPCIGLLTAQGTKYPEEILQLLDAVWAPKEVAVKHCKGYQNAATLEMNGNGKVDKEAIGTVFRLQITLQMKRPGLLGKLGTILKEDGESLQMGTICKQCLACTQKKPWQGPTQPQGIQEVRAAPCENFLVDFTELPWAESYCYVFVWVCTYSSWVAAFLTRTQKAQEVTGILLKDIIPRFGLPSTIG